MSLRTALSLYKYTVKIDMKSLNTAVSMLKIDSHFPIGIIKAIRDQAQLQASICASITIQVYHMKIYIIFKECQKILLN